MRFWRKSLQARLTGYFILFLLLSSVVVGTLSYWQSRIALQEDVIQRLETAATLEEDEIGRWLVEKKQAVRLLAQTPLIKTSIESLLTLDQTDPAFQTGYQSVSVYLNDVLQESPDLLEVLILDQNGQVILSTSKSHEGNFHRTDTFFIEGQKDTFIQNVYFLPYLNRTTITIATPVGQDTGQGTGVLVAHLDLNRLDEIILERAGLGQTGETYLVDSLNVFVSQTGIDPAAFPRGVHAEGIDRALSGENGHGFYLNYNGVPVIGVYRWLADQEMALLAEIEQSEALAPVNRLGFIIAFITLVVIILVSVAGYLIARQISRPILAIGATASQVAVGHLSQRAPVLTEDEIGDLAQTFNLMTAQLEDLYATLEERINARTYRLEIVASLSERLTAILDLEKLLQTLVNQVKESFGYYHAHVYLLDTSSNTSSSEGGVLTLAAGVGEAGAQMKAEGHHIPLNAPTSLVARAARSGEIVSIDNVREALDWLPNPLLPDTHSEMAVPIILEGRVVGVLDVQEDETAGLDEGDEALLRSLANQVAVAIRNAHLFAEVEAALSQAGLTQEKYIERAWQQVAVGGQSVEHLHTRSATAPPLPESLIAQARQAAIVQNEPVLLNLDGAETRLKSIVAPVTLSAQTIGLLQVHQPEAIGPDESTAHSWSEEDLTFVQTVLDQVAQTAENLRLFDETRKRAGREQTIREITDKLRAAPNLKRLVEIATEELGQRLSATHAKLELGFETEPAPGGDGQNGQDDGRGEGAL